MKRRAGVLAIAVIVLSIYIVGDFVKTSDFRKEWRADTLEMHQRINIMNTKLEVIRNGQ